MFATSRCPACTASAAFDDQFAKAFSLLAAAGMRLLYPSLIFEFAELNCSVHPIVCDSEVAAALLLHFAEGFGCLASG